MINAPIGLRNRKSNQQKNSLNSQGPGEYFIGNGDEK
jgi:hypothetical protein